MSFCINCGATLMLEREYKLCEKCRTDTLPVSPAPSANWEVRPKFENIISRLMEKHDKLWRNPLMDDNNADLIVLGKIFKRILEDPSSEWYYGILLINEEVHGLAGNEEEMVKKFLTKVKS